MNVRRLAAGVLLPGFSGPGVPDWVLRAADDGLAGVCLFAQNVPVPDALRRPGLLVASDEEGGSVTRLDAAAGSPWPSASALGHLDETDVTEGVGAGIGRACRDAGVTLALAPVADVNAERDNPVIGIRSFGADPALVARHVAAAVRGLQGAGVAACAKHFPGHGSTTVDSHLALPTVDWAPSRDLPPFAAAVQAGVAAVMTAHVRVPAFGEAPATTSPRLLRLLRDDLGFIGVVVSDAVDMRALGPDRGASAVAALTAGVDLVCLGNPAFPARYDDEAAYRGVLAAVVAAVEDGTLPRARLEQARERVTALATPMPPGPSRVLDPGPVLARVVEAVGDVRIGRGPHVLDLTGGPGLAAGPRGDRLAIALRAGDPAVTSGADLDEAPAGRPLVALVTRPGAAVDRLRAARPDAVLVHVGVGSGAAGWRPDGPAVIAHGEGRGHADAVSALLRGVAR